MSQEYLKLDNTDLKRFEFNFLKFELLGRSNIIFSNFFKEEKITKTKLGKKNRKNKIYLDACAY